MSRKVFYYRNATISKYLILKKGKQKCSCNNAQVRHFLCKWDSLLHFYSIQKRLQKKFPILTCSGLVSVLVGHELRSAGSQLVRFISESGKFSVSVWNSDSCSSTSCSSWTSVTNSLVCWCGGLETEIKIYYDKNVDNYMTFENRIKWPLAVVDGGRYLVIKQWNNLSGWGGCWQVDSYSWNQSLSLYIGLTVL